MTESAPHPLSIPARALAALMAIVGWCALVLQYVILIANAPGLGLGAGEATIRFVSYFTIESNILVALVGTCAALGWRNVLSGNGLRSAVAVYIAMVGIVYMLILRKLWAPEGAQYVADLLLHDVAPVLYLIFWLAFVPKAGLRWIDPLIWLIYPVLYLLAILARGVFSGFFPYPFIDLAQLSPQIVARNALVLLAVFLVMGLVLVAFGRLRRPRGT